MKFAHTVDQVRAAEAAHPGLASGALMQRAAYGLATAVIDFLGGAYGRRIVLLIGPGNNGADTLYAGALLARRGAMVEAWLLGDRAHEAALAALRSAGGRIADPRPLRAGEADAVIDGVVGIGGRPGLPARIAEAVIPINRSIPFIAVDLPSGVDADTGELPAMALSADLTITFGTHKFAHLLDPAAAHCGTVTLVDLGLDLPPAPLQSLQSADVAHLVRRARPTDQKYTRGVVGLRAGSATYPGAALLAVAGANTGLAGMVRYVGSAADLVAAAHPEVVGSGRVQAWVVGPGGGDEAAAHLDEALRDDVPIVVDADGLRAVTDLDPAARAGSALVLTPHAGELASLLGADRREVEARPLHYAQVAATEFDAVVLLKGRRSVIAQPAGAGPARVNTTGTPWLATAGAGDVLAGLIGSLLAAGLTPFDAASAGAWIHGAAATRASRGPVGCGGVNNPRDPSSERGIDHGSPLIARAVAQAIPAVVGDWEA